MFEYSKAAFGKVVSDVKKLVYACDITVQALMIVYLIYALVTDAGKLWANIPLLVICVGYFLFFLLYTKGNPFHKRNGAEKTVGKIVKYSKLFIKFCTLGVTLYGIYIATTHPTAPAVMLAAMSIVGWLLQVVFEVIKLIVENLFDLAKEAVTADVEEIMKPVTTVKNFFKKNTEQETEPAKEKTKRRLWLDEKVSKMREEKRAKKEAESLAKKQAKLAKKNPPQIEDKK